MSGGGLKEVWGSPYTPTRPLPNTPDTLPRPLSRHLRDTLQNPARLPPDTLQTPSTPLPDPNQTPLRPKPPIHPHIHPPETPSHPPPSTLRHPLRHHPGPSYRVWAITDGAVSLAVLAKLLDTQTCQYVKWKLRDCATSYRCFFL